MYTVGIMSLKFFFFFSLKLNIYGLVVYFYQNIKRACLNIIYALSSVSLYCLPLRS